MRLSAPRKRKEEEGTEMAGAGDPLFLPVESLVVRTVH